MLPSLYNYFTKILVVYQMADKSERALRPVFYNNPFLIQQAMDMMMNYSYAEGEQVIMLLHHYNLKSVGIKNYGTSPGSLMKEMVYKIIRGNLK